MELSASKWAAHPCRCVQNEEYEQRSILEPPFYDVIASHLPNHFEFCFIFKKCCTE